MLVERTPELPYGWRFGIIVREGDMRVHGWLLHGTSNDPRRAAQVEEFMCAGSMPELQIYAMRRIAEVMDGASI